MCIISIDSKKDIGKVILEMIIVSFLWLTISSPNIMWLTEMISPFLPSLIQVDGSVLAIFLPFLFFPLFYYCC
jgi:hypothetical protein